MERDLDTGVLCGGGDSCLVGAPGLGMVLWKLKRDKKTVRKQWQAYWGGGGICRKNFKKNCD